MTPCGSGAVFGGTVCVVRGGRGEERKVDKILLKSNAEQVNDQ